MFRDLLYGMHSSMFRKFSEYIILCYYSIYMFLKENEGVGYIGCCLMQNVSVKKNPPGRDHATSDR